MRQTSNQSLLAPTPRQFRTNPKTFR